MLCLPKISDRPRFAQLSPVLVGLPEDKLTLSFPLRSSCCRYIGRDLVNVMTCVLILA